MTVPDWIAVLGVVLLMASAFFWGIPWNRFTEESRKIRCVDSVAFKRASVIVCAGALFSGFLLGLFAFITSFELYVQARTPSMIFLGLIAFPVGFAVLITSMFFIKVATLRTLYKTDRQSQSSRKQNGDPE